MVAITTTMRYYPDALSDHIKKRLQLKRKHNDADESRVAAAAAAAGCADDKEVLDEKKR